MEKEISGYVCWAFKFALNQFQNKRLSLKNSSRTSKLRIVPKKVRVSKKSWPKLTKFHEVLLTTKRGRGKENQQLPKKNSDISGITTWPLVTTFVGQLSNKDAALRPGPCHIQPSSAEHSLGQNSFWKTCLRPNILHIKVIKLPQTSTLGLNHSRF